MGATMAVEEIRQAVPQPDANGEFVTPAEGAKFMASFGIPQIPLRGKAPWFSDWPKKASTDFIQIDQWYAEHKCNFGSVANGKFFVLEVDSQDVRKRHFEDTKTDFTKTLSIVSRQGGHRWYVTTTEMAALGNVTQAFVKGEDFSVRVFDQQCVSPGSIHPETFKQYAVSRNTAPVAITADEVSWFRAQKTQAKTKIQDDGKSEIHKHARNDTLASIAGRLRASGLDYEQMRAALSDINQKRCVPPLPEIEIDSIAGSYAKYKAGAPEKDVVIIGDKIIVPGAPIEVSATNLLDPKAAAEAVEIAIRKERAANEELTASLNLEAFRHPKFPRWVMTGTSVYEGLVKPFCEANTRYEEYMFMPAMVLLLNYVANKVRVEHKQLIPSIFMVSIGKAGQVIKSGCVESAIEYFTNAGMIDHANTVMDNANGKALVWTIGSPEGLGPEMARLKCKNAILFYDELASLTSKASIEGSNLRNALLTTYESGKWQNLIKSKKDSFSFDPKTYCVSLIACCTEKSFIDEWMKLVGKSSGLDTRVFFLYQPEVLKPMIPYTYVNTAPAAIKTRQLVDKAVQQGVFSILNSRPLQEQMEALGNRGVTRAEKFALFFAIDLGLDEIDEECIERGLALANYEKEVKRFLAMGEAETKEGALQQKIIRALRKNAGIMTLRDLKNNCNAGRYGTTEWGRAYEGLKRDGQIKQEGAGSASDPYMVRLIRIDHQDED
jgi:Primase C terminal 1 (PriCT-1)/Bifunctional DNA primase/polymerase, N-terminal